MERKKPRVTVITPGKDEAVKVVKDLQKALKGDPRLAEQFRSSPRGYLGALGLNEDLQNQLLHEANLPAEREGCKFTCISTCQLSCLITNINL